jgi:hypothetical protein
MEICIALHVMEVLMLCTPHAKPQITTSQISTRAQKSRQSEAVASVITAPGEKREISGNSREFTEVPILNSQLAAGPATHRYPPAQQAGLMLIPGKIQIKNLPDYPDLIGFIIFIIW